MTRGLCRDGRHGEHPARGREPCAGAGRRLRPTAPGDFCMQWQTPTATDFRFGFEITLYVAAR